MDAEQRGPTEKIDWRARGIEWMLSQGPSAVMLAAMCVGIWYGIPWGRSCMKEDMNSIQAAHKENIAEVVKAWNLQIDKTIEAFKADQERDARMLERAQQINERLLNDRRDALPDGLARP